MFSHRRKERGAVLITVLLAVLLAVALPSLTRGHRVKPGETLWRISKAYNVDLQRWAATGALMNLPAVVIVVLVTVILVIGILQPRVLLDL